MLDVTVDELSLFDMARPVQSFKTFTTTAASTLISTTSNSRSTAFLKPASTTLKPVLTTLKPASTTLKPVLTTLKLVLTTSQSASVTPNPDLTTSQSASVTPNPDKSNLGKNPSQAALTILNYVYSAKMIVFSFTGFFSAILFGFACYESYVVYAFCHKVKKQNEPIYATIPLKSLPELSIFCAKKKTEKSNSPKSNVIPETHPRPILPTPPVLSFVERVAKFDLFFSNKKTPVLPTNQVSGANADTETAKIHKPYVPLPSFVFNAADDEIEIANETFVTSVPLKSNEMNAPKVDQSFLDLQNVIVSYTNENYVPPSSLPRMPPLIFQTFKKPNGEKSIEKRLRRIEPNPDAIELAPN